MADDNDERDWRDILKEAMANASAFGESSQEPTEFVIVDQDITPEQLMQFLQEISCIQEHTFLEQDPYVMDDSIPMDRVLH